MARLSAVVSAITFLFMASLASAVGLSEITLRSALTEPLDAQIRITSPGDLSPEELTARLASAAEFSRAGIERPLFLTELRFNVAERDGQFWVDVTSANPVEEPFLDFLVELAWPGGRLLREYTLLLDPPVFAPGEAPAQVFQGQDPSFSQQAPTPTVETAPPVAPSVETPDVQEPVEPPTVPPTVAREETLADDQYRVLNNDTLWEIALQARSDATQTPQQIMLAIQDLNPDAFINNNINRVKAGSLLTLPNGEQVLVRSQAQAVQEVDRQNRAFRGLPPPGQQQATASGDAASATASSTPRNPDGFLEIVGSASDASEGTADGATQQAELARVQNELAIQQELNDELRRQNEQQLSRLNELEEQVRLLTQMMELQSAAAAEMQEAARALQQQAQANQQMSPAAPALEPQPAVSFTDRVMQVWNRLYAWLMIPTNALIVALGAVLALGLILLARRRRDAAEDEVEELLDDAEDVLLHDDPYQDLADEDTDYTEDELSDDVEPVTLAQESNTSVAEALENAELYMAFQRHDEAETVLKQALAEEPANRDVRLKLLELYAETGRVDEFDALAAELTPAEKDDVARLRSVMQKLGTGLGVGAGSAAFASAVETPAEEDFADLDLDLDMDDDASWSASASTDSDDAFDLDMASDPDALADSDDDLDLSDALNDDFDKELDEELTDLDLPAVADEDEDSDLDLDLSDLDVPDLNVPELDDEADIPLVDVPANPSAAIDEDDLDPEIAAALATTEADAHLDTELDELGDLSDLDLDALSLDDAEEDVLDVASLLEEDDEPVDEPLRSASMDDDFSKSLSDTLDELSDEPEQGGSTATAPYVADEEDSGLDDDGFADLGELDDLDDMLDTERFVESSGEAPLTEGGLDDFDLQDDVMSFSARDDVDTGEERPADVGLDDLSELDEMAEAGGTSGAAESDEWDDDFDFLAGSDEIATKLDLARAYIDMDDVEGAKDILNEVVEEGNEEQKAAAEALLRKL